MNFALSNEGFRAGGSPELSAHGTTVWRLFDGTSCIEARVADCGIRGYEYRLFVDGRFTCSVRFGALQEAMKTLIEVQSDYLRSGRWQLAS